MTYKKPDVHNLGPAVAVIQVILDKPGTQIEFTDGQCNMNPAYDLDE
ncbi:MAG: hypothetical protein ACM3SW_16340 [Actinomycetota bacterium]